MRAKAAIAHLIAQGFFRRAETLAKRNHHAAVLDQSVVRLMWTFSTHAGFTPARALRQLFPEDFK